MSAGSSALAQGTETAVGLLDVYHLAVSQDAILAEARAQFSSEQKSLDTAFANLLPQVKLDASYFVTDSSLPTKDVTTKEISLTFNQSIYKHEAWAGYAQVKRVIEKAKYVEKSAEQNLILRVTEAYLKVLLAQQTLTLMRAKEQADRIQLDRVTASEEIGLASRVDVLQVKSSYDLSRSDRMNAVNELDLSQASLAKLTGIQSLFLKSLAVKTVLPINQRKGSELTEQAARDNLMVRQAVAQVAFAVEDISVKKGGYWPTIDFQAKLIDSRYADYSNPFFKDNQRSVVGVTLSIPLYSGGGTASQVDSARYKATAAKAGLRDAQEQARLDARVQSRNLKRGVLLLLALEEAVASNNAFVEAAEEGFRIGLKSLLEVLTARSNQYEAYKNLLEATHNQVLNTLKLEATLGDLTEEDLLVFDRLLITASPRFIQ